MDVAVNDDDEAAASTMNIVRRSAPGLLKRVQTGISHFEIVYTPHSHWPLPRNASNAEVLTVSVLDSSFNPPTLAHLALADTQRPHYPDSSDSDYDAKLLLLSIKNVDKMLKPGDATYLQRLEMMGLLAKRMSQSGAKESNVAIAIIDEPTFVAKSRTLLACLDARLRTFPITSNPPSLELSFILGMDTLERLFAPRYYASETDMMDSLRQFLLPPPAGDGSRVLCANRVMTPPDLLSPKRPPLPIPEAAKEFFDKHRISLFDIGDRLSTYSSSAVRGAVGQVGPDGNGGGLWRAFVTDEVADYICENKLYVDQ